MTSLLQLSLPVDSIFSLRSTGESSFGKLIKDGKYEEVLDNMFTWGINLMVSVIIAIALFFIGRFLIIRINRLATKILQKSSLDNTLKGFMGSVLQTFLYIVLFMIIINAVGVKTVSIAAIIGTMGLAIGLAMKDNLSNFAGGVMILISKPFRSGDSIVAQNMEGVVEKIGIFHTLIKTAENKTIYMPNGPLSTGNIVNNNSLDGTLRTEITVHVKYGSDVDEVKELLLRIARQHPKVLTNPAPFARMTKIDQTSLEFVCRAWADKASSNDVFLDLNEAFYKQLYEKGMITPSQQMSVYLSKEGDNPPNIQS